MSLLLAAVLSIQIHGLSLHTSGSGWNEVNVGAGLRYQMSDDWAIQAGAYRNSYSKTSAYTAVEWSPVAVWGCRLGAFAGAVNGYQHINGGRVAPAGGLSARYDWERMNTILRFVPPTKEKEAGMFALEIGVKF